MGELRKLLAWAAALLVIAFAGDRLLSLLLRYPLLHSQFRFSRLYRGGSDAEVVIFGDSRGVTTLPPSFVEKLSGLRAFSLAYNGMATPIAEALLSDYLDRHRPPRMVIIEVTCTGESMTLVSELKTYAGLSPRLASLYARQHPVAARVARVSRLFLFNSELFLRAVYYLRRDDQDWSNSATISAFELEQARSGGPWTLQPRAESIDSLERMIRLLRSRGIEVRLIIGPYLPQHVAHARLEPFLAAVADRAHRVDPALSVWNYASAVTDATRFADTVHMNDRGAAELMPLLQRDGFFAAQSAVGHAQP